MSKVKPTACKICMNCCLPKTIKKEDVKSNGEIHEYNYTCYECLEKMRNRLLVYQGLKEVGILELIPPEDKKADEELDRIEKLWEAKKGNSSFPLPPILKKNL